MKLKTTIIIIVVSIFTALIGANIYDWYKR